MSRGKLNLAAHAVGNSFAACRRRSFRGGSVRFGGGGGGKELGHLGIGLLRLVAASGCLEATDGVHQQIKRLGAVRSVVLLQALRDVALRETDGPANRRESVSGAGTGWHVLGRERPGACRQPQASCCWLCCHLHDTLHTPSPHQASPSAPPAAPGPHCRCRRFGCHAAALQRPSAAAAQPADLAHPAAARQGGQSPPGAAHPPRRQRRPAQSFLPPSGARFGPFQPRPPAAPSGLPGCHQAAPRCWVLAPPAVQRPGGRVLRRRVPRRVLPPAGGGRARLPPAQPAASRAQSSRCG